MPLFQTGNFPTSLQPGIGVNGSWALWRLDEPEEELLALLNEAIFDTAELQQFRLAQRRQEWLGCRLALQALLYAHLALPDAAGALAGGLRMQKNELGRPYLLGGELHLSLSHAYPYAAAALHPQLAVGLDVEQPRQQLLRIRHKFLSVPEQALLGDDLQQLCLWWAAKEALYKMHGQPGLIFAQDMLVRPSDQPGRLLGWLKGQEYQLHYQWQNGLLLCVVA